MSAIALMASRIIASSAVGIRDCDTQRRKTPQEERAQGARRYTRSYTVCGVSPFSDPFTVFLPCTETFFGALTPSRI
jgi:hypothetical protein